jgi:hypothetical protein
MDQGVWGSDPGQQPLMSCRHGEGRGHRGRSRPPPARSLRPPAAAARDPTATTSWSPWSKLPTASQISEARPLPSHAARDPTAAAPWPPWSKPPAASRISEAARYRHARPDCRHTVVEAAHRAMVAGARLGGGCERGAIITLVFIIVVVPATLVNDHLLLLEHAPLRVSDGGHGRTMAAATAGTMETSSRCTLRRPCCAVALSRASRTVTPQLLGEERKREERMRSS